MNTVATNFDPAIHGFSFPNRFDCDDFFQMKLPVFTTVIASLNDLVYGLCGGMCFAALDHYYAQTHPPKYPSSDELPWRYFLYLWQRQLDSMAKTTIPKLFKWMYSDDITLARDIKRYEVRKVMDRVNAGNPAALVLVRVKAGGDPTNNHQVLAIGYEQDPANGDLNLILYDPNHAGKQPKLTMNLSNPNQGINLAQTTKEPVRGFFVINYEKQDPYTISP